MKNMFTKKGFTLIEILIVVAIIGILASVVVVGIGPAQKNGRDARRISDLRSVQNALELYYGKLGYYPKGTYNTWSDFAAELTGAGIGTKQIPIDPSNSAPYVYAYASDANGTTYVLGARFENTTSKTLDSGYQGAWPSGGSDVNTSVVGACSQRTATAATYCLTL